MFLIFSGYERVGTVDVKIESNGTSIHLQCDRKCPRCDWETGSQSVINNQIVLFYQFKLCSNLTFFTLHLNTTMLLILILRQSYISLIIFIADL